MEQDQSYRKQIHIVGGGTIEPVREHLALTAPAYGSTARQLGQLCEELMPAMDTNVHLTKMADPTSDLTTSADLAKLAREITADYATKLVFWLPAVCDFSGQVGDLASGLHADRLSSAHGVDMRLTPTPKILSLFRRDSLDGQEPRKDIFAIGFKTTTGADSTTQYSAGLNLLKANSLNLVLANDLQTGNNMIVVPEEAPYDETTDRAAILRSLVEMVDLRSQLTFTRSTVVAGEPVPWRDPRVFPALREVVDYCIDHDAYKPFRGVTAGHFAVKIGEKEFLTSRRKTDFNDLGKIGLVRVETDGPDNVIAYGSKPSVGGQSQRIVFEKHPDKDCIVHFHCPIKSGSTIPVISQREFECGSHQCGENTANGLREYPESGVAAVYLDNHGPNLVFNHDADPQKIIAFIDANFDLSAKTGTYIPKVES